MRKNKYLIVLLAVLLFGNEKVIAQAYNSYFTGSSTDVVTSPLGGICLMGGATENDQAMIWFLERASGGDILVLRASGSDGYNNYFFSELGVTVNSVETIVCNQASASENPYVLERIEKAEAIWFAGGNQWNYISYWRNSSVATKINEAINQRNVVIGGTSAGMAIQGEYYFSAQNGTVTSSQAMSNPYGNLVTIENESFIENEFLIHTVTDTHFDSPDRRGRLATFLARMHVEGIIAPRGIACDEYTAVCVDDQGIARVFGTAADQDYAYFVTSNCILENIGPENCSPANPLTWDANGEALVVYRVKGTEEGTGGMNLSNWQQHQGGEWFRWSVVNGVFAQTASSEVACISETEEAEQTVIRCYPNPVESVLYFSRKENIELFDSTGRKIAEGQHDRFDFTTLPSGPYLLRFLDSNETARIVH